MNETISRLTGFVGIILLASMCGCGSKPAAPEVKGELTGNVTLDGQPLDGAMITFEPTGNAKGGGMTAVSDTDGTYRAEVTVVGPCKVFVSKMVVGEGADDQQLVPKQYLAPDTSPLTAEVSPSGTYDIELTSGG